MSALEYCIDTNIFIRFLVKDDARMFRECSELIDEIQHEHILAYTPIPVLAEVQWVLKSFYKFEKSEVVKALKSIIAFSQEPPDVPAAGTALSLYEQHSVKFIDALIASHPRIQDGSMAVISYDKDFDKLGVSRLEPKGVLKTLRKRK